MGLSYRHAFHAGNIHDTLKHAVLAAVLSSVRRRFDRVIYIDTHAGSGRYHLSSHEAQKRCEYRGGIGRLLHNRAVASRSHSVKSWDRSLAPYLDVVKALNENQSVEGLTPETISWYPGSPTIAASILDQTPAKLILCEMQEAEAQLLRREMNDLLPDLNEAIQVKCMDGFSLLREAKNKGFHTEAGHMVSLIDPPYESADEYQMSIQGLYDAVAGFPSGQGTHILWFPILHRGAQARKVAALTKAREALKRILLGQTALEIEMRIPPEAHFIAEEKVAESRRQRRMLRSKHERFSSMSGSVLYVVNPCMETSSDLTMGTLPALKELLNYVGNEERDNGDLTFGSRIDIFTRATNKRV